MPWEIGPGYSKTTQESSFRELPWLVQADESRAPHEPFPQPDPQWQLGRMSPFNIRLTPRNREAKPIESPRSEIQ